MSGKSKPKIKLLDLKEWLTLEDAASHPSLLFDEEVAVSDVLRLALDGRLTLSVWFVNHAYARKGKLVSLEECPMMLCAKADSALAGKVPNIRKTGVLLADLPTLAKEILEGLQSGDMFLTPQAIRYTEEQYLVLEKHVVVIEGIWDLPMLGSERLDVEHRYQQETGGPPITLTQLDGTFVERDGVICQLQEDEEENEFCPGSEAHGRRIEERIINEELDKAQADDLRQQYAEQRKKFKEKRKSKSRDQYSYPAGKLPDDAVWVVRTAALRAFEQSIAEPADKPMSVRAETTLLNITGALLGLMLSKTPSGKPQSVFKDQAAVIDALLAAYEGKPGIAKRTLEEKLAAAKRSLEY